MLHFPRTFWGKNSQSREILNVLIILTKKIIMHKILKFISTVIDFTCTLKIKYIK